MKKSIVIVSSIVVLLLIGMGVIYWQWSKSPTYSFWQAKKSIEKHDLISFRKYVDVESLAGRMIDQMLETNTSQNKATDQWEQLGQNMAQGLVNIMKPQLTKLAKEQVESYIEKGAFETKTTDAPTEGFSVENLYSKVGGAKSEFKRIEYVKKDGKIAVIGLEIKHPEYTVPLIMEIKMRDIGGYWQIAEIANFAGMMKKIDEFEAERLKEINKPIMDAIQKSISVGEIKKSTVSDEWGIQKKLKLSMKARNINDKDIVAYTAIVKFEDMAGKTIMEMRVSDNEKIAVGKTGGGVWMKDVNMFDKSDNDVYNTPQEKLKIVTEFIYVKLADGKELKIQGR